MNEIKLKYFLNENTTKNTQLINKVYSIYVKSFFFLQKLRKVIKF